MASFVAPGLLQAYVEKKLHKEKMMRMEEEMEASKDSKSSDAYGKKKKKKQSVFGLLRKKVHPDELSKQTRSSMD